MKNEIPTGDLSKFVKETNFNQCVPDTLTLQEVSIVLAGNNLSEVLVVNRQQEFKFIFTMKDFATAVANEYSLESQIQDIKSKFSRLHLTAENSVSEAKEIMETENWSCLPYLFKNKIIGVVRKQDLTETENSYVLGKVDVTRTSKGMTGDSPESVGINSKATLPTTKKTKLLIVEDDLDLQNHLTEVLIRNGFGVNCAPTCEEALEKLETESYDLVLSDIRLPKSDGIDLLMYTRDSKNDTPFILMSGYLAYYGKKMKQVELNEDFAISKPIDVNTLLNAIGKRLESHSPSTSS